MTYIEFMKKLSLILFLVSPLFLILLQNKVHGTKPVHWDYEHEQSWGTLTNDYHLCKDGKHQSPINIGLNQLDLNEEGLKFNYHHSSTIVNNNGHSIQYNLQETNYITYLGKKYDLLQVHFHAHSEHAIQGEFAPLEAHLVHKSKDGELAVVAFLIDQGSENDLNGIFQNSPMIGGKGIKNLHLEKINKVSPKHYSYEGSLTTPPCSEGVHWIVMAKRFHITKSHLDAFKKYYDHNYRSLQPLNGREVHFSMK
jgi:carbonic anhydrase